MRVPRMPALAASPLCQGMRPSRPRTSSLKRNLPFSMTRRRTNEPGRGLSGGTGAGVRARPHSIPATGLDCDASAMKHRLSVYLDPGLMAQLNDLADRRGQPKSLVAEAAIAAFLTPDDSDRRKAALARGLERLARQAERLERDLTISVEALALFVHYCLSLIPTLPERAQAAAQAKGRECFASFVETLGRRLASGKSFLREISTDVEAETAGGFLKIVAARP